MDEESFPPLCRLKNFMLERAAKEGHADIVHALITKCQADLNGACNADIDDPWDEEVEFLSMDCGGSGSTPLHVAALGGHTAVVDILLKLHVDVEARDGNMQSDDEYAT